MKTRVQPSAPRRRARVATSLLLALAAAATACGDTGQKEITFPIRVSGAVGKPVIVGSWVVTLDLARVAVGPMYFCASAAVDPELCRVAVGELAEADVVDALQPMPTLLGEGFGVTAAIRRVSFDYGISWLPTQAEARPASTAPEGHSAILEGVATNGARTFRFHAAIDVVPLRQGGRSVNGLPSSVTLSEHSVLYLSLDPSRWIAAVDFDDVAASSQSGTVEILPDSRAYRAIVTAMTASNPPSLVWSSATSSPNP